ncbi:hypothetical protein VP01_10255g1 [Puccinia sorghi]|uniref:Uncharacterized protein n=1 Tax=Puccinia sorghi TaxID=27349 RepID=A0A0L6VUP2_9BASI|nr:hypothetical protein VP01_10255g1 [Puccinia sorghi]
MADAGGAQGPVTQINALNEAARNDGFRQAMLKYALDTTPQLTEENYPVCKDKMTGLLELSDENAKLKLLFISKMD